MDTNLREKPLALTQIIDYLPNAITQKQLLKKATGELQIFCGDELTELKTSDNRFDTCIVMLEGSALITIKDKEIIIAAVQIFIIPAFSNYSMKANEQFKLLSITIKSGYE